MKFCNNSATARYIIQSDQFCFFLAFSDNTDHNSRDGSGIDNLEAESERDMKIERKKRLNWQPH